MNYNFSASAVRQARVTAIKFLEKQVFNEVGASLGFSPLQEKAAQVVASGPTFGLAPFFISKGKLKKLIRAYFFA